MTIGEKRQRPGSQERLHVLVLARLFKEEPVVALVLLVREDRGDVDDVVIAVLHAQDVHDPVPRSLQVAGVHGSNLYIRDREGVIRDWFGLSRLPFFWVILQGYAAGAVTYCTRYNQQQDERDAKLKYGNSKASVLIYTVNVGINPPP